jgi:hypothetical protein
MFSALKSFFLSQSQATVVIKKFFENSFSEIYFWHIHSFMSMFQTDVEALHREGTSKTEMQTILHTVHTSIAERLASKFDTKNQTIGDTNVRRWL